MKLGKIIAVLGLVAMTAVLVYGFTIGDFSAEGAVLTRMPWGIVSLVDLYTGFVLFSGWIFYREKSLLRAALWTVAVMVLGHFTTSLYVLLALLSSRGDWKRFWMGQRA
jgi:hypothetical protein